MTVEQGSPTPTGQSREVKPRIRTGAEDDAVTRWLRVFDSALTDRDEAADRALEAAEELSDLGVDVRKIRDWQWRA